MDQGRPRRFGNLPQQLAGRAAGSPTDEALLRRFTAERDEAAFELLVYRHAALVLGVCRRLLRDPHDADDAFQATFLALARRAGSITRREAVGTWLYRVAHRAALCVRAGRARHTSRQVAGVELLPSPPVAEADPDLGRALHEEVQRLPARNRAAFVLCCLEGRSAEDAARLLGCAPGTVSSRLTRARQRLRDRLSRRGLAPALVATAVSPVASAVPPTLIEVTVRAAPAFAWGRGAARGLPPGRAEAIAEGVLRAMTLTQLRAPALLLACLLAAGGFLTLYAPGATPPPPPGNSEKAAPATKNAPPVPVVIVAKPSQGGLPRISRLTASVEPFQQVDLYPAVAGHVTTRVDIGTAVKKGQVLADIESRTLLYNIQQARLSRSEAQSLVGQARAQLRAAKAESHAARATVSQRQADLGAAQTAVESERAHLDNVKRLHQDKVVSSGEVQEKERSLAMAKSRADAALAAIETAKADLEFKSAREAIAEATVETARVKLEAAELQIQIADQERAKEHLYAPFDGVVTRRNYGTGQYVRPAEGSASLPVVTVQRMDRVRVVAQLPEHDVPLAEPGKPVNVWFNALPNARFDDLKLSRIGYAEDPATRTMRVEIDMPNPSGKVRPGMFGTASIRLQEASPDALHVPTSALFPLPSTPDQDDRAGVYVVRDGKAWLTLVQVGPTSGDEAEVRAGLKSDDLVVVRIVSGRPDQPLSRIDAQLQGESVPVEVREQSQKK